MKFRSEANKLQKNGRELVSEQERGLLSEILSAEVQFKLVSFQTDLANNSVFANLQRSKEMTPMLNHSVLFNQNISVFAAEQFRKIQSRL